MDQPELPPGYTVEFDGSDELPYRARYGSEFDDFGARDDAVADCWAHWRKHGDPAWVEYFDHADERAVALQLQAEERARRLVEGVLAGPLDEERPSFDGEPRTWSELGEAIRADKAGEPGGDAMTRVPFDGYLDITPEQRGPCQALIDARGKVIKQATGAAPTVDTVVLASHLAQFADAALAEDGFAPSKQAAKLSQALFGGATATSEICSLLLSQLVMRLYSAPYGGLNEAGLDFVNTLLVVLSTALPAPRKLKHPGG